MIKKRFLKMSNILLACRALKLYKMLCNVQDVKYCCARIATQFRPNALTKIVMGLQRNLNRSTDLKWGISKTYGFSAQRTSAKCIQMELHMIRFLNIKTDACINIMFAHSVVLKRIQQILYAKILYRVLN